MTNVNTINLVDNGIYIELDGNTIGTIDIPSDYVPRGFAPILGTHLLLTGDKLKEGMIVLLEDNIFRRDIPKEGEEISSYEQEKLDEGSRWAVVTDIRVNRNGVDSSIVKFTAIYADGTMRDRTYNVSYKWSVLREFKMVPACPNCGSVHSNEKAPDVDLETEVPVFLKGLLGIVLGGISEDFLDGLLSGLNGEEEEDHSDQESAPHPDETPAEYMERLRDEAERNGEYHQDERPKLSSDAALAALRAKLMGEPAPTETGLNGYPQQ